MAGGRRGHPLGRRASPRPGEPLLFVSGVSRAWRPVPEPGAGPACGGRAVYSPDRRGSREDSSGAAASAGMPVISGRKRRVGDRVWPMRASVCA